MAVASCPVSSVLLQRLKQTKTVTTGRKQTKATWMGCLCLILVTSYRLIIISKQTILLKFIGTHQMLHFEDSPEQTQANGQQAGSIWVLLGASILLLFGFQHLELWQSSTVSLKFPCAHWMRVPVEPMSGESAAPVWRLLGGLTLWEGRGANDLPWAPALWARLSQLISSRSLISQPQDSRDQESVYGFRKDSHTAHSSHGFLGL